MVSKAVPGIHFGNLAYTKMDQPPRQTNGRTAYQSDSVNQVLPSKTHQVDSKQDYGPLVRTNLTLKKILHRVVKLILQGHFGMLNALHTPLTFSLPSVAWLCHRADNGQRLTTGRPPPVLPFCSTHSMVTIGRGLAERFKTTQSYLSPHKKIRSVNR